MKKNKGSIGIFELVMIALVLIVLVTILFSSVGFFIGIRKFFVESFDPKYVGGIVNVILSIFSIFFLTVIAYSSVRLLEVRKREHEHLHHEIEEYRRKKEEEEHRKEGSGVSVKNPRWARVLEYLLSNNPSDWKLSIIEADSMLADLLEKLGFPGENLGEKLKGANVDNFRFLDAAWEAHTVRNKIAHEADFEISSREAKRIISIYEDIFRGYEYI